METETHIITFTSLLDKVKYHFTKSRVIYDMAFFINKQIPNAIFASALQEGLSINQYLECIEDSKNQHTGVATVRLSYDGVKLYFSRKANSFFQNYNDANIRILEFSEIKEIDELGDLSFDMVVEIDGEIIPIEIKVTQNNKNFTGTNHSTKKVENYLFIALEVDRNRVVEKDKNYLVGLLADFKSFKLTDWKGDRTKDNSRTSLGFNKNDIGLVCGSVDSKGKFIFEKLIYE